LHAGVSDTPILHLVYRASIIWRKFDSTHRAIPGHSQHSYSAIALIFTRRRRVKHISALSTGCETLLVHDKGIRFRRDSSVPIFWVAQTLACHSSLTSGAISPVHYRVCDKQAHHVSLPNHRGYSVYLKKDDISAHLWDKSRIKLLDSGRLGLDRQRLQLGFAKCVASHMTANFAKFQGSPSLVCCIWCSVPGRGVVSTYTMSAREMIHGGKN
jgi:hypothetical protein